MSSDWISGGSGDLLPPPPPAEQTTACQDQTRQASTGDQAPNGASRDRHQCVLAGHLALALERIRWPQTMSASAGRKRCVWIGAEFRRSSAAIATRREGHLPRSVRRMLKRRPGLLLATYEILGFRGIKPGASRRLNPARHRLAS